MREIIEPLLYIGQDFGIYTITELMPEKNKYNHRVYKGVCKECGYEKYEVINYFKTKNVQKCSHMRFLTQDKIDAWYEKNKIKCLYCEEVIPLGNLSFIEYKKRKFCNNSCAAAYNNQLNDKKYKEIKYCKNCGSEIKKSNKYCSQKCQYEFEYKENIKKWKNGEIDGTSKTGAVEFVKRYIREKYNNQCCKCGWHEINPVTGKVPVELHHIDGNYKNNKEENLELLCPNCHSLTATYRALNCGDGRKDRYK